MFGFTDTDEKRVPTDVIISFDGTWRIKTGRDTLTAKGQPENQTLIQFLADSNIHNPKEVNQIISDVCSIGIKIRNDRISTDAWGDSPIKY